MPTFTKITKVGAFSDDVANQINQNFAQLGTVLSLSGIDPQKTLEKARQQRAQAHDEQPDEPVPDPSKPWYTDPPIEQPKTPDGPEQRPLHDPSEPKEHRTPQEPEPKARKSNK